MIRKLWNWLQVPVKRIGFALVLALLIPAVSAAQQGVPAGAYTPGGASGTVTSTIVLPSGVDVGSGSNAYVVNPVPAVTATFGASFTFTTTHASTGAATMNASGTGVKNFRTQTNNGFTGTEINSGGTQIYQATYDGTEWLLAGVIGAGNPANPAGTLNLGGTYLIGTPRSGIGGSSSGLTFVATPGNSGTFDRNLLNFVWLPSSGGAGLFTSFGFDGDNVFQITGNVNTVAVEIPWETFSSVSLFNQGTGTSLTLQQNNTPSPGTAAIALFRPIGGDGALLWGLESQSGRITTYDAIATVSNGVPSELAMIDLTGQTSAKTTTTLYTPTATGMFRISVYAKVTTVDGSSSSLGGTTGLTIGYADGTDSIAQTLVAQLAKETGSAAIVNSGNTTATKLLGSVIVFAQIGVPITYAFDYTSGTAGTMAYELHLKVEAL